MTYINLKCLNLYKKKATTASVTIGCSLRIPHALAQVFVCLDENGLSQFTPCFAGIKWPQKFFSS